MFYYTHGDVLLLIRMTMGGVNYLHHAAIGMIQGPGYDIGLFESFHRTWRTATDVLVLTVLGFAQGIWNMESKSYFSELHQTVYLLI